MKREEMPNVICDQGTPELCRTLEDHGVGNPDKVLMLSGNRFDLPFPAPELDSDLRVEHLVEEELC